jgi:signal transduction histidine kinase
VARSCTVWYSVCVEAMRHGEETDRVAALHSYEILDTPREAEFDEIVKVVSAICGTPISVINLIDRDRQWFKAEVGLGVRETPLPASICAHAILQPGLFIVPDTTLDKRFADNSLVTGNPNLRFYAGALLETPEGLPLGTICVLDYKPRELDDNQKALLRLMSQQIMKLFELRRLNSVEHKARESAESTLTTANTEAELREQFIAVLGHDLRNPLGAILAGTERLQRGTSNVDETLSLMRGSIWRMSALIDNVLDFARGRLGNGIELVRTDVALEPVFRQVIDELRVTAPDRAIDCELALDRPVYCDAGRIGQLLSNLVGNALTHGAAASPVRVRARVEADVFELQVGNAGAAIPSTKLAKLFHPFFRGEVRSGQQGLGLGLYIAAQISQAHGGTLDATSSAEQTVFTFRMPLAAETPR